MKNFFYIVVFIAIFKPFMFNFWDFIDIIINISYTAMNNFAFDKKNYVLLAIGMLVELRSPLHQLADLFRRFCHHLTHSRRVADVVAGNHGVVDVFFKIVFLKVGHRRHATLREARIGLIERCFADDANLSFFRLGHFQGVAHACYTGANDQKVVLVSHNECVMSVQNY